jgi:hypothetical protein
MLIDADDGVEQPSLRCDDDKEIESSSLFSFVLGNQIHIHYEFKMFISKDLLISAEFMKFSTPCFNSSIKATS